MNRIMHVFIVFILCSGASAQTGDLTEAVERAEKLQSEGRYREAVELMQNMVLTYPERAESYLSLGMAWGALGQVSGSRGDFITALKAVREGFSAFEKAAEIEPDNYDVQFTYGVWGVSVPGFFNKLEEGLMHLRKALDLAHTMEPLQRREKEAAVYRFLGQGYKQKRSFPEARDAFIQSLKRSGEGESAAFIRAELESIEGKETVSAEIGVRSSDPKLRALEEKAVRSPHRFDALFELGRAYFDAGMWSMASDALRKAAGIRTDDDEAQFLLAKAVAMDASVQYDERVYENTDTRTHLAIDAAEQAKRAVALAPDHPDIALFYASLMVEMPFFVGGLDEGIAVLEKWIGDASVPDSIREDGLFQLGAAYRKKGHAVWMQLMRDFPGSDRIRHVYDEYGPRNRPQEAPVQGERMVVTFHLGFKDELAPQTGLWIEDAHGHFVRTLYVSGFSGYARDKQVNLPEWAGSSGFETDGTTAASIDWGQWTFIWDLKDGNGSRVQDGTYLVRLEASWWPSMKYSRSDLEIRIGQEKEKRVENPPLIPVLQVELVE